MKPAIETSRATNSYTLKQQETEHRAGPCRPDQQTENGATMNYAQTTTFDLRLGTFDPPKAFPFQHRGLHSLEKSIAFLGKSIGKSITKCYVYSDTLDGFREQEML